MSKAIKYASVCSGVEAASLAWHPLGWEPVWFSEIEPFPCEVLRQRFPGVPNLGDMTKIKIERTDSETTFTGENNAVTVPGGIDLLVGGTPCFVAGTLILTPSGYRPIEELKVGDKVVNADLEEDEVTAVGHKDAQIGTFKVFGRKLICTPNHPFMTAEIKRDERQKITGYGDWGFAAAEDSAKRYCARLPLLTDAKECRCPENNTGLDDGTLMRIAGWYVAVGHIKPDHNNNKAVVWDFKQSKSGFLGTIAMNQFQRDIGPSVYRWLGDKAVIENTALADWLVDNFGQFFAEKRIPFWVYRSSLRSEFTNCYEHAESWCSGNVLRVPFESKVLACGYADLKQDASVELRTPLHKGKARRSGTWMVSTFIKNRTDVKFINGRFASKAKGFEYGTTGTVYNITVRNKHTYIAEGLAVHNCQDVSIAGQRAGFIKGERSSLAFHYAEIAYRSRARWLVWENVPGSLSSDNGLGLAKFFSCLAGWNVAVPEHGWQNAGIIQNATTGNYGLAYRVLDAQYVRTQRFPRAIPQRRRRLFLVGCLGDWQRAAEVLFVGEGLLGYTAPRRVKGQGVTGDIEKCVGATSRTPGIHDRQGYCGLCETNVHGEREAQVSGRPSSDDRPLDGLAEVATSRTQTNGEQESSGSAESGN